MQWTRRTFLGSIAAGSVSLAGCSLGPVSGGAADSGAGGGAGFEAVRVAGRTLVVSLGSVSAETVNVIAPDGSAYASRDVISGATRIEFEIVLPYAPGEYQVVATQDGSTVAKTAIEITPDVGIQMVGVGANHLEQMPADLNYAGEQAIIEVTNHGNGPQIIEKLLVLGGVPNPTTELRSENVEASGIFDTDDGYGDQQRVVVPANGSTLLYTTTKPFLFAGEGVDCKSKTQSTTFEIKLLVGIGGQSVSSQYTAEYTASEEPAKCHTSIKTRRT